MRSILSTALFATFVLTSCAQPPLNSEDQLPGWMHAALTGKAPARAWKADGPAVHTNAFIGRAALAVLAPDGRPNGRITYWSDAERMVFQEYDQRDTLKWTVLVDLAANIEMDVRHYRAKRAVEILDLDLPGLGHSHDVWVDTLLATGRTERICGTGTNVQYGWNEGQDTVQYWSTDAYSGLFADIAAWSQPLKKGALEYVYTLNDRRSGPALRVQWKSRKYGPAAGGLAFTSIEPGTFPMPVVRIGDHAVEEHRLAWVNRSNLGRLPNWMLPHLTSLTLDPVAVKATPRVTERDLPDNRFIGSFTAEQLEQWVGGVPGRGALGQKDVMCTIRYRYWADARRAMLIKEDTCQHRLWAFLVDLDEDVLVFAKDEGTQVVLPHVYITDLSDIHWPEFGEGIPVELTPTGKPTITVAGHTCTSYTTSNKDFFGPVWLSDVADNPLMDMAHWMDKRMAYNFRDLFLLAIAHQPMPFTAGVVHVTELHTGDQPRPVLRLQNYLVRDERLEAPREEERRQQEKRLQDVRAVPEVELDGPEEIRPPPPPVEAPQR